MAGNKVVQIDDPVTKKTIEYSMDITLRKVMDKLKGTLRQQDRDFVLIVDGPEGAGKSTLALQIAKYYDPTLNLDRVVFTAEEFRDAIYNAPKGSAIVFDEAFVGLSSRTALSKINKMLVSLMMQMRQRNLFVVLVMPSFFLLDKYAALFRSRLLINVYELKGKRGYFQVYNRRDKKTLFLTGSKLYTYSKVKTNFRGRFYGKFALGDKYEGIYRKKKEQALIETEKPQQTENNKFLNQRNALLGLIKQNKFLSAKQMGDFFKKMNFDVGERQIYKISSRFKGKIPEIER